MSGVLAFTPTVVACIAPRTASEVGLSRGTLATRRRCGSTLLGPRRSGRRSLPRDARFGGPCLPTSRGDRGTRRGFIVYVRFTNQSGPSDRLSCGAAARFGRDQAIASQARRAVNRPRQQRPRIQVQSQPFVQQLRIEAPNRDRLFRSLLLDRQVPNRPHVARSANWFPARRGRRFPGWSHPPARRRFD